MRRPKPLTAVVLLAVVLLAGAVLTGIRWHRAEHDPGIATADARDLVLVKAENAAIRLSSLDYRATTPAATWKQVATGDLYSSLVAGKSDYEQLITEGKVISTATTTGAAVQSLTDHDRTAVVLIGLDVTVTPEQGAPSVQHERLVLTMQHTKNGWKASAMQPVGAS
ncbi:hypothetical protein [Nocardioides marmorisolisilvae]|uniref:Mce-associated membrane protein n=1 Tax=Nocardioides marmorisolisilvae TaxID=1542737 RepID=A0A3N0DX19_9ACTN|nr:hypothetical protein [Nocardioides marmorisolisilvae]RNL80168.1 hypothetical protein EFL95_14800 [Nocardioides marmorisolisilvae]